MISSLPPCFYHSPKPRSPQRRGNFRSSGSVVSSVDLARQNFAIKIYSSFRVVKYEYFVRKWSRGRRCFSTKRCRRWRGDNPRKIGSHPWHFLLRRCAVVRWTMQHHRVAPRRPKRRRQRRDHHLLPLFSLSTSQPTGKRFIPSWYPGISPISPLYKVPKITLCWSYVMYSIIWWSDLQFKSYRWDSYHRNKPVKYYIMYWTSSLHFMPHVKQRGSFIVPWYFCQ